MIPLDDIEASIEGGTWALRNLIEKHQEPARSELLVGLWYVSQRDDLAELERIVAMHAARLEDSLGIALRLWFMTQRVEDLGIAISILSGLETEAYEQRSWPRALCGQIPGFLASASQHSSEAVRAAVLSALVPALRFIDFLHPSVAVRLANSLETNLREIVEDEEIQHLRDVTSVLAQTQAPLVLPRSQRALQRVALDVMDFQDQFGSLPVDVSSLVGNVNRCALLDDAGEMVIEMSSPIQTVRVTGDRASTQVIDSLIQVGEAIASIFRPPDLIFHDDAKYFGSRIAWAPAASVPLHLIYSDDSARQVFRAFVELEKVRSNEEQAEFFATEWGATTAMSMVRLVEKIRTDAAEVELLLTDPSPNSPWQQSITIGPNFLGRRSLSAVIKQFRRAARAKGVYLHTRDVPQANTVKQVFQAVDAMLQKGFVDASDIDNISTERQVAYYKHGARVLGFFDADNQPTQRAYSIAGRAYEQRLTVTSIFFEDSALGRAWRGWAGKSRLVDVDPLSAIDFLEDTVPGLSGSTPGRRASTLRTWFEELMVHYPDGDGQDRIQTN